MSCRPAGTLGEDLHPHEWRFHARRERQEKLLLAVDLEQLWPVNNTRCTIPRVHNPSREEFTERFMKQGEKDKQRHSLRPRQNEDALWRKHSAARCCPPWQNAATLLREHFLVQDIKFVPATNVARVAKRVTFGEHDHVSNVGRHNVSSFCRPLTRHWHRGITPRFWVSGYCTNWQIHVSFDCSDWRLLNAKTWPRNSILSLDTSDTFLNASVAI